ncbi:hypothetical protein TNCV_3065121 [Trichonephila clavipes]|nr:hypothetical protein TNCV_3065121 [Trichonephila clavipes]
MGRETYLTKKRSGINLEIENFIDRIIELTHTSNLHTRKSVGVGRERANSPGIKLYTPQKSVQCWDKMRGRKPIRLGKEAEEILKRGTLMAY